jgi:hypothetical protein
MRRERAAVHFRNRSTRRSQPGDGQPGDGQPGDGQPGDGQPGDGQPGDWSRLYNITAIKPFLPQ